MKQCRRNNKQYDHAGIQKGEGTGDLDPLENHKAVGFLRNTGMDPPGKSQSNPASIQCQAIIGPPTKHH